MLSNYSCLAALLYYSDLMSLHTCLVFEDPCHLIQSKKNNKSE